MQKAGSRTLRQRTSPSRMTMSQKRKAEKVSLVENQVIVRIDIRSHLIRLTKVEKKDLNLYVFNLYVFNLYVFNLYVCIWKLLSHY